MDPSKNVKNETGADDNERNDDAARALMEVLSLDRSTPMSTFRELVQRILASSRYAHLLPVLICYLRNHNKSMAPGIGSGERTIAERLCVALYETDNTAGLMLLRFLVAYGSWKSLLNILILCDQLCNADSEEESIESMVVSPATTKGEGPTPIVSVRPVRPPTARGNRSDPPTPRQSAAEKGPYRDLCKQIHELFSKQLLQDRDAVDAVDNNAPGRVPVVSNAAKFAPHEKRGSKLTSAHADAVASILFSNEKGCNSSSNDNDKRHLRKLYRQLRSRLNEANRHLPDRYLAMHRADELDIKNITAGYMAKSRKALLNIDSGPGKKKMRYDDPARIALRQRVLEAAMDPGRVPAPSDLAQLANGLLDIASDKEEVDDGERTLLESSYLKAVMVLSTKIKQRRNEVYGLIKALSTDMDEDMDVRTTPSEVIVAVDVSPSQSYAFPMAAILVLLLNDAVDALEEENETEIPEGSDNAESKPSARQCIIFHHSARTLPLPLSRSAPVHERLAQLVKEFRSAKLTVENKDEIDYQDLMQALNRKVEDKPNSTIVVCSDFTSSNEFALAIEKHFKGDQEISCWRMSKPSRQRERNIVWDPEKPHIDLCIALDTTGSMGGFITHCKSQIEALLQKITDGSGMPVTCSFVSYKDFNNPGHLEVYPWTDARNARLVADLRHFIDGLQPSGGDDAEEDIAGALETVHSLMLQRAGARALKLVLLIADAGAHGYPSGRPNYRGVDQKERLRMVVRKLAAAPENGGLGCELLLAKITQRTDLTCDAIDQWLQSERTFIEQIEMGHASSTVFRDKVLASVQQVVAHAIAPPSAKGVDVVAGTDFSVCEVLVNARLANYAARLTEQIMAVEEVEDDEEEDQPMSASDNEKEDPAEDVQRDTLPTALANLLGKLESEDYNMVRQAMGTIKEGLYADYETPPDQGLSKASMIALVQAGLTVEDLRSGGYPEHIIDVFVECVKDKLTEGAGKKS